MSPDPSHSSRRLPSWPACLACAGVLVTLSIALTLLYYSCPAYDDLYRGGIVRVRPWYREIAWNYTGWSGRWSGIGVALLLFPRIDLFKWYPALLMVLVIFQALGLRAFWRLLLGETAPRRTVLALIATTMAVIWAGLPTPSETWYWMTGGLENQLGIFLSLSLIGCLVESRWEEMSPWQARARVAALSLLALFVTGLHEVNALILCLVLVCGSAIVLMSRLSTPRRRAWLAICACAMIGFGIVVLAPGNLIRAEYIARQHPEGELRLRHTIRVICGQVSTKVPGWVLDVRLLSATLVLVLSPFFARARAGGLRRGGIPPRLLILAAWTAGIAAIFIGSISAIHGPMYGRTLGATYIFFVLGWITLVFVCTRAKAGPADAEAKALEAIGPRFARSAALVVLGVSLVFTGNTRDGIRALRAGAPQTWSHIIHRADRSMRQAASQGVADFVWPMDNRAAVYVAKFSKVFNFHGMTDDPSFEHNLHYAMYYNFKSTRRVPRRGPPAAGPAGRPEAVGVKPNDAAAVR
jgi:Family of unknown function (DUF6056)